jgi:large subunit ribosomal protein L25
MAEVALAADVRSDLGSSNSRRLRTSGRIPGVLYGHGIAPQPLSVDGRALRAALHTDAGLNALINLNVAGEKHLALARVIQRHPVRGTVAHVDFQVVSRTEQITADIPITFVGEATKVTKNGGLLEHVLTSINVTATPSTLPDQVELDISELELDSSLRVKDIPLPKGVIANADPEEPVIVGATTRAAAGTGAEGTEEGGEEAAASTES